jgi:hypothetical protein
MGGLRWTNKHLYGRTEVNQQSLIWEDRGEPTSTYMGGPRWTNKHLYGRTEVNQQAVIWEDRGEPTSTYMGGRRWTNKHLYGRTEVNQQALIWEEGGEPTSPADCAMNSCTDDLKGHFPNSLHKCEPLCPSHCIGHLSCSRLYHPVALRRRLKVGDHRRGASFAPI